MDNGDISDRAERRLATIVERQRGAVTSMARSAERSAASSCVLASSL
jgi:hypothetical protein